MVFQNVGILQSLVNSVVGLIWSFCDVLPDTTHYDMANFYKAVDWILGFLVKLDFILPVQTMFTIFGLVFGMEVIIFLVWIVRFIIGLIRGM